MVHIKIRSAFTLLELLVVIAIIGVLLAMLLAALPLVEEQARVLQCTNRMRQLGVALHSYHNDFQCFPAEKAPCAQSELLFVVLLPYIERQHIDLTDPPFIPDYACPSRKRTDLDGPKSDFAAGHHYPDVSKYRLTVLGVQGLHSGPILLPGNTWPSSPQCNFMPSLELISSNDGATGTILLGHKHVQVQAVGIWNHGHMHDDGWNVPYTASPHLNHQRRTPRVNDGVSEAPLLPGISFQSGAFASEHPRGLPVLMVDGAVNMFKPRDRLNGSSSEWARWGAWTALWTWNDGGGRVDSME